MLYDRPKDKPTNPVITGPTIGKTGAISCFDISSIDPNGNNVYFYIDWCDGTYTDWIGPYLSGEKVSISHTWNENGTYIIRVKAKDVDGEESDWSVHNIAMSKQKPVNQIIYDFLKNFFTNRLKNKFFI